MVLYEQQIPIDELFSKHIRSIFEFPMKPVTIILPRGSKCPVTYGQDCTYHE